jgi:hypothetical protein
MAKKLKPCSQCAELAAERDQFLSYRDLYEESKEKNAELEAALKRA